MTTDAAVDIVPANRASCEDLKAVFGTRGDASRCQCQRYKIRDMVWSSVPVEERAFRLRDETDCGHPESTETSGLVAYLDGEPVAWCAVEPRSAYERLRYTRVPWAGRTENKDDDSVWAITCFVTRTGFRRQGITRALARAAVDFARERGARALEGYPMITQPGEEITWGELHVGARSAFADAGFTEVSHPTLRRVVMRIDFKAHGVGRQDIRAPIRGAQPRQRQRRVNGPQSLPSLTCSQGCPQRWRLTPRPTSTHPLSGRWLRR
jgi:GNAT superfamily N-acetyltransferase